MILSQRILQRSTHSDGPGCLLQCGNAQYMLKTVMKQRFYSFSVVFHIHSDNIATRRCVVSETH